MDGLYCPVVVDRGSLESLRGRPQAAKTKRRETESMVHGRPLLSGGGGQGVVRESLRQTSGCQDKAP